MPSVKIGMLSRVDFGSPGFRKGLLDLAYQRFREAGVNFVIFAGGLIAGKAMKQILPKNKDEQESFFETIAQDIAKFFPRVHRDDEIKTYLMISPAYDGLVGEAVAARLVNLRSDLRLYPKPVERFPLKGIKKTIADITPVKASWRADYASTPVDRLLKDELKRSTQPPADVYAVGCCGVFMHRPKGESPCEYFALPALNKPEEITSTENQVGVVIVEINDDVRVTNISMKDVVSNERMLIKPPSGLSDFEQKIFNRLCKGPATPGIIEDDLHESRTKVTKALKKLASIRRRNYPSIREDVASGRYDFDLSWRQRHLQYPWYPDAEIKEDRIVGFSCLHAGSIFTEYEFTVNEIARIILSENANVFMALGDLIQGLKHNLMLRGEIVACADNYTKQEKLAGDMMATAIFKVFSARFEARLKAGGVKDVDALVAECLIPFAYIPGNHDEWEKEVGVTPLDKFHSTIVSKLCESIESVLQQKQLKVSALQAIVNSRVVALEPLDNRCTLASGLKIGLRHPYTGRAQTTTLRLQQSMGAMPDCHVVLIGNFHTATAMNMWMAELGQRCGMQFGTLMFKSDFEEKKNKVVDFGIGCLRIRSHNGRIIEVQNMFYGEPKRKAVSNDELMVAFKNKRGIL